MDLVYVKEILQLISCRMIALWVVWELKSGAGSGTENESDEQKIRPVCHLYLGLFVEI